MRRTHFFSNWYSGTNTSLTETAVNEKKKTWKTGENTEKQKTGGNIEKQGKQGKTQGIMENIGNQKKTEKNMGKHRKS